MSIKLTCNYMMMIVKIMTMIMMVVDVMMAIMMILVLIKGHDYDDYCDDDDDCDDDNNNKDYNASHVHI